MKLDSLSKECVIIGSLTLALSLVLIRMEAEKLATILGSDNSQEIRSPFIKEHCHKLVAYVAAALISILIIVGITKKHAILMAPWLLAAFAGVTFSVYFIVGNLMTLRFGHMEFMFYTIAIIGLESVVLYPLCTLFDELRRERADKLRRQIQRRGLTVKK